MAFNKQRSAGFKNGRPLGDSKPKGGSSRRDDEKRANDARPARKPAQSGADHGKSRYDDFKKGAPPRFAPSNASPSDNAPSKGAAARPRPEKRTFSVSPSPAPVRSEPVAVQVEENELPLLLYGRNPVREAIKSGRSIDRILVMPLGAEDGSLREIVNMARDAGLVISETTRAKLDELTLPFGYSGKPANHQGIVARIPDCQYVEVEDMLSLAREKGEQPFVIVLDSINDPHNLGSIIRSALCAGVHGVIIPKRRAASVTAAAAKASAGAIAYMPVARVSNLTVTVEKLKDAGLWIVGADADGTPMSDVPLKGAIALVIGGEDEGISRLLREKCDFVASIPMRGEVNSLNASVAAAVLMYEKLRQDNT